jgi:glutathione S-transferase
LSTVDQIHYLRIPNGRGGRAEQVRLVYVLAGKPYEDVIAAFADAQKTVTGRNPYRQFPFVVTPSGEVVYQTVAIMQHAANGTPIWPSKPAELTRALEVGFGAYDLYQAFGGFAADDLVAKKKFEDRRVPQYFGGLSELYGQMPFATGDTPTFADVMASEAMGWCARRNEVAAAALAASPSLQAFVARFEAIPAVKTFRAKQAAARELDNAV